MASKAPCVYIMASERNGTPYVGTTSNLLRRVHEHREGLVDGFSKKYGAKTLVWYEGVPDMTNALALETRIKKYRRTWNHRLIEKDNPEWSDLYNDLP